MKISIIGAGYVGLVTAACFADAKHEVICVDKSEKLVEKLKDAEIEIYEPGLIDLVKKNFKLGHLQFTTDINWAIERSDILVVAVGTPNSKDGKTSLSQFFEVLEKVINYSSAEKTIIIKSTVPVGTTDQIVRMINEQNKANLLSVVFNPEFLREGSAVEDFLNPDRIVVGSQNPRSFGLLVELYQPQIKKGCPLLKMSNKAAELTKYAANCFLAAKISFINEMALIADSLNVDIEEVKKGLSYDQRIGSSFFNPGIGFGGSCLPKDLSSLIAQSEMRQLQVPLLRSIQKVNQNQISNIIEKINFHFPSLKNLKMAVWGLSFKPNTNDLREAPSLKVIEYLLQKGSKVCIYDPVIKRADFIHHYEKEIQMGAMNDVLKNLNENLFFEDRFETVIEEAAALLIFTEWDEFKRADLKSISLKMKQKIIFDARNIFEPKSLKELGFVFHNFGRKTLYEKYFGDRWRWIYWKPPL